MEKGKSASMIARNKRKQTFNHYRINEQILESI